MDILDRSQKILMLAIEKEACLNAIPKQALSMERKDLVDKLESNLRIQFYKHCAKIILYPNSSFIGHWIGEMIALIQWVQYIKLKPKNTKVNKKLLRDTFFNLCDSQETFKALLNNVEKEYDKSEINKDNIQIYQKFWQFIDEVIKELEYKTLTVNILTNLVNQYLI